MSSWDPREWTRAIEEFRAVLSPTLATEAFRDEAMRILSYVPDHVDAQRATDILDATADVTPEIQAYIEAQIARNNAY